MADWITPDSWRFTIQGSEFCAGCRRDNLTYLRELEMQAARKYILEVVSELDRRRQQAAQAESDYWRCIDER